MALQIISGIVLLALSSMGITGTAAAAAPAPVWASQNVLTTDSISSTGEFSINYRFNSPEPDSELSAVNTPSALSFLKYRQIPAFLTQSETVSRSIQFTNTSAEDYTVEGFTGTSVNQTFVGSSNTHYVAGEGTSFLQQPVPDFTVPAGETIVKKIESSIPYASIIRTNGAGEITGFGSATRYTASINGQDYWFQEVIGFGSVMNDASQKPNPASSTTNLFAHCEESEPVPAGAEPVITIGACSPPAVSSITLDHSNLEPTAPTEPEQPPVTTPPTVEPVTVSGSVMTSQGEPLAGFQVRLVNSEGETTHTTVSTSTGSWQVEQVYPELYSAYLLLDGIWTLISSPEDFVVADSDLSGKDFVLERYVAVPPVITPPADGGSDLPPVTTPEDGEPPVEPTAPPTSTPTVPPVSTPTDDPTTPTTPAPVGDGGGGDSPTTHGDPAPAPKPHNGSQLAHTGTESPALPISIATALLLMGSIMLMLFGRKPAAVRAGRSLFIFEKKDLK